MTPSRKPSAVPTPQLLEGEKPKEPRTYEGWSYKDRSCLRHKKTKLVKDDHECCGCCCSGCQPVFHCPKCQAAYETAYSKWVRKWGHLVAVGEHLFVRDGKLLSMNGVVFQQLLHGGKPLKEGKWCKWGPNGYIVRANKPHYPQMLVVG